MPNTDDDPVYLEARREALFLLVLWLVCALWSVGWCYTFGYSDHPRASGDVTSLVPDLSAHNQSGVPATDPLGLGIPSWVFWGILVPWFFSVVVSVWFAFFWMKDDPESAAPPPEDRS